MSPSDAHDPSSTSATPPAFTAFPAWSKDLSLDTVLGRLEANPEVAAVLLLGSTAEGLTDSSDYDLLVVMREGEPFGFEYTFVEGRETDIVLLLQAELERVLSLKAWVEPGERDIISWIAAARVAFSEDDFLSDAPERARRIHSASQPVARSEAYYRWVEANFNLSKSRRYLTSATPTYAFALEVRLATALSELPQDYLIAHGRHWLGEKDAFEFLLEHDPSFAEDLIDALRSEASLATRLDAYADLMRRAFVDVGAEWGSLETAGGWFQMDGSPRERSRWESLASE